MTCKKTVASQDNRIEKFKSTTRTYYYSCLLFVKEITIKKITLSQGTYLNNSIETITYMLNQKISSLKRFIVLYIY